VRYGLLALARSPPGGGIRLGGPVLARPSCRLSKNLDPIWTLWASYDIRLRHKSPAFISGAFASSGRQDLNLRPPGPQPGALPGCATPRGRIDSTLPDRALRPGQMRTYVPTRFGWIRDPTAQRPRRPALSGGSMDGPPRPCPLKSSKDICLWLTADLSCVSVGDVDRPNRSTSSTGDGRPRLNGITTVDRAERTTTGSTTPQQAALHRPGASAKASTRPRES
jgi:hypothetical protein